MDRVRRNPSNFNEWKEGMTTASQAAVKESPEEVVARRLQELLDHSERFLRDVPAMMQTRVDLVTEGRLNSRVLKTITGKWSVEIIVLLYMARSMGFEELRKHLAGISSRTLSLRLKELEEHGFVKRTVKSERPPRVHYSLTEKGRAVATLSGPLIYYIRSQQHLLFPRGSPAPAREV